MDMNKAFFTNHLRVFSLTALLWTLLPAIAFAQATSAESASAVPKTSQALELNSLSLEFLKNKRTESETAKGLTEPVRKQVIDQWDRAITFRKETDRLEAEIVRSTNQVRQAPERMKDIKWRLSREGPSFDKKTALAEATDMPLETIEQRLREVKAALAAAQGTLNSRQDQIEKLKNSPSTAQKAIADAKSRIQDLKKELDKIKPSDASKAPDESLQAALLTEHTKLLTGIRFYEQAILNHDVLIALLTAEVDLARHDVKTLELKTKAWEEAAQKRRQQEAKEARVEAEAAKKITPDLPKAVKEQYDVNISLGKDLEKITAEEAQAVRILDRRQSELKMLEEEFSQARQRIQSVALSEMSGITLRKRRQALPSPKRYRQDSKKRQLIMGHVSEGQFNIDEQRRNLLDLQDEKRRIIELIGRETAENLTEWEDKVQTLLTDQRDLLEKLQGALRRYYKNLQSLEFTEQQLAAKTDEYADFLDGHLLWIRSSKVLSPTDLRNLPDAIMWIASPSNWFQLVRDLAGSLRHSPMGFLLGLISAGLLFVGRKRAWRKIEQLSEIVGRVKQDSFVITVQAFGLTMYLAVAWPFLVILAGWRLAVFPYATDFSQAASFVLLKIGGGWAILLLMYYICHNRGLAQIHFRWSDISRMTLRRHLAWLMPVYLFCAFPATIIMAADHTAYTDSLGRLMFIATMAAFALFAVKMLPAVDANSHISREDSDKRRIPLKFIWYPLAIALPSLLVIMAVMGYYYSAYNLTRQFNNTVFLVIALILGNNLVLRWLVVAQRRLAYEETIRKRQERREAERVQQGDPGVSEDQKEIKSLDIEEPEITRAQIDEQTRSLLQTILIFSVVLGLWAIWDEVLPALNVFENTTLWSYSVEVDGVTRMMPITLVNVMMAIVTATITFIAARNLPGVLEISLLKYLPLDAGARYAFCTICRYALSMVGIIIAFNYIGVSWSSLKWLVAALSVGLGFGLQEIVANFVSGLIILFERPIRVGDLVTVGNVDGTVTRIRIRATTITNWDRKEYIVPNKEFITGNIMNWTLSNPINRVVVEVGVAYGSDTEKALETLLKVARELPFVLEDPAPLATFEGFGDNALVFTLRCYLANFKNRMSNRTAIHMAIDKAFREAGITIAFAQRDVHFDTGRPLQVNITSDKQEE